jgi:hypothetical protein
MTGCTDTLGKDGKGSGKPSVGFDAVPVDLALNVGAFLVRGPLLEFIPCHVAEQGEERPALDERYKVMQRRHVALSGLERALASPRI